MTDRPTVLFITHSVEEAVGLSDRVLVMSPSPGEVVDELRIELPRPRPVTLGEDPALAEYARRIYDHFARLGVIQAERPGLRPGLLASLTEGQRESHGNRDWISSRSGSTTSSPRPSARPT